MELDRETLASIFASRVSLAKKTEDQAAEVAGLLDTCLRWEEIED